MDSNVVSTISRKVAEQKEKGKKNLFLMSLSLTNEEKYQIEKYCSENNLKLELKPCARKLYDLIIEIP